MTLRLLRGRQYGWRQQGLVVHRSNPLQSRFNSVQRTDACSNTLYFIFLSSPPIDRGRKSIDLIFDLKRVITPFAAESAKLEAGQGDTSFDLQHPCELFDG
jgi:hypothetical protein